MSVGLIVLVVALAAGFAAAVWSISAEAGTTPIDPRAERRWLVRKLASRPRLASFVGRRLDRSTAGGLLLSAGLLTVLGLAAVVGVVFDMVATDTGLAGYDMAVAEYGASQGGTLAAEFQAVLTQLGGTEVVLVVAFAVGLWGWWRYGNLHVLYFMITVVAGQALINTGLKLLVERDRPDLAQLAPFSGSSFPSGHTAAAAATYAAVALVLTIGASPRARALVAGLAAFLAAGVGATRALLGVHWLTDVLAGFAVGYAWYIVCAVVYGGRIIRLGEPAEHLEARAGGADRGRG